MSAMAAKKQGERAAAARSICATWNEGKEPDLKNVKWSKGTLKPQVRDLRSEIKARDKKARPDGWDAKKCVKWLMKEEHMPTSSTPLVAGGRVKTPVKLDEDSSSSSGSSDSSSSSDDESSSSNSSDFTCHRT